MDALRETEHVVPSLQPLDTTVGDEFQAVYATVADAALAALLVRLALLPDVDTRYGLGHGAFTVFDADRRLLSQDGPAWWAAREAVSTAKRLGDRPRSRHVRTWYATGDDADTAAAVNAFLSCRDSILGRMNHRSLRLLRGVLLGQQQGALAKTEGIGQSAISQALIRSGAYAVLESHELLRSVR